jgi:hypothetical protein
MNKLCKTFKLARTLNLNGISLYSIRFTRIANVLRETTLKVVEHYFTG